MPKGETSKGASTGLSLPCQIVKNKFTTTSNHPVPSRPISPSPTYTRIARVAPRRSILAQQELEMEAAATTGRPARMRGGEPAIEEGLGSGRPAERCTPARGTTAPAPSHEPPNPSLLAKCGGAEERVGLRPTACRKSLCTGQERGVPAWLPPRIVGIISVHLCWYLQSSGYYFAIFCKFVIMY